MNILVIDEEFPFPLNNGKRTRSFSLARVLASLHDVSYLAYGSHGSDAIRALEAEGVECHAIEPPDLRQHGAGFYWRLFANLWSSLPYIVTSHHTRRFQERLDSMLADGRFDVILCEWTPYAIFVRSVMHVPAVIVAHNIESQIWRRYEENERSPLRRLYISIQRRKVEQFERNCFSWVSGATAVSDAEAREIESYGCGFPVETIDNGVDVDFFRPLEEPAARRTIIFSGALDWRPNQDAVLYFVREVFPHVRAKLPDVEFSVVGRNPPPSLLRLDKLDGVRVTGTVPDVRPYFEEAALCVVPLRIGGGSRLKILNAMAMQRPVVSTTIGAEGLEITPGFDILLADEPREFAACIVDSLENPEKLRTVAAAGRQLVETRYRWDSLGRKLERYLARVLQSR